jgi:chromate transport protein ChrA
MLLLANSCLAGITKARTSIDARELSAAVLAPAVIGLVVVSAASIFRMARSRRIRARILLGTMILLFLGLCVYPLTRSPEVPSGTADSP